MEWCWDNPRCLKPGTGCTQSRATCKDAIDCDCDDCNNSEQCGGPAVPTPPPAPTPPVPTPTQPTYSCVNNQCVAHAGGTLSKEACAGMCIQLFTCSSNKCSPNSIGVSQAVCEANCGLALRGSLIALDE